MSGPVFASPNFDLQAAMEAVKKARAEGFEAGRAAFAADLREQGKVVVDRIALLDAGAMLKAWAPKGSGGWVQQIEETLPEAFDV